MDNSPANDHQFWTEIGEAASLRFVTEKSAASTASTMRFRVPFSPLGHTVASLR